MKWLTDCFLSNAIPDSPWLFFRSLDFSLQINYDDTSLLFRNVTVSLQKSLPQYAARKASGGNCTSVKKCNKKHHSSQVALPLVNASIKEPSGFVHKKITDLQAIRWERTNFTVHRFSLVKNEQLRKTAVC